MKLIIRQSPPPPEKDESEIEVWLEKDGDDIRVMSICNYGNCQRLSLIEARLTASGDIYLAGGGNFRHK